MPMQFYEIPDSRSFSLVPPSYQLRYKSSGEPDDAIVQAYAISVTPAAAATAAGILYRQDVSVEPDGYAQYIITVPYGPLNSSTAGEYTFSFDTTGGTVNMKCARQHIASYLESGLDTAYELDGSIGVNEDGSVEGVEVVIPALRFTVQFRHPLGEVTIPFVKNLARNTGKTNSEPFLTFDAGELLYLGSSGSDGTVAEAEIAYHFAASENATVTFGVIAGIVKLGHNYAWVQFHSEPSDGQAAVKPKRVHVERVYNSINFATVFGWG